MRCIFWFFLVILLIGCNNNSENEELELQVEDLKTARDSLIRLNSQLENKMDSMNNETNFWFDNNTEGKHLLDSGLKDPGEFIISSLKQQPELIPADPVLGGRMRFTRVQLLGKDCLIAYYEDGHIAGRAIYSFVFEGGKLNFSLVKKCSG